MKCLLRGLVPETKRSGATCVAPGHAFYALKSELVALTMPSIQRKASEGNLPPGKSEGPPYRIWWYGVRSRAGQPGGSGWQDRASTRPPGAQLLRPVLQVMETLLTGASR